MFDSLSAAGPNMSADSAGQMISADAAGPNMSADSAGQIISADAAGQNMSADASGQNIGRPPRIGGATAAGWYFRLTLHPLSSFLAKTA